MRATKTGGSTAARRGWLLTALVLLSTSLSLVLGELGIRALDGFAFDSLRLSRRVRDPEAADASLARRYATRPPAVEGVDSRWFDLDPPVGPRADVDAELSRRYWSHRGAELLSIYWWNRDYVLARLCAHRNEFAALHDLFVFDPPGSGLYPRFHFPPQSALPSGLVTNRYGWRGPDVPPERPANAVRIAFVGASTTVNPHGFRFSYPEHVGHWLELWARARRLPVVFEILNTGHEGQNSNDFAAIVRDELVPLDPDFVVYYEGSNQFWPEDFVAWPGGVLPPKPTLTLRRPAWIEDHSALAKRVAVLARRRAGRERARRLGRIDWPSTLSEADPELSHPKLPLNLRIILADLDAMRGALAPSRGTLVLSSFVWLVHDGLILDPVKHQHIYGYLNSTFWPFPYGHMRRMADFQNRVFNKYASSNGLPFVDVARDFPQDPDLFEDAVHMTPAGVRLHAWICLQQLMPLLEAQIRKGLLPRPPARSLRGVSPALSRPARLVSLQELAVSCAGPSASTH